MGHTADHLAPAPPAAFTDLDGSNGFAIYGLHEYSFLGQGVGGSGDVNGDGLDDVLVSARDVDPNGLLDAGEVYVIFGQPGSFPAVFDQTTLDGGNGFSIAGVNAGDGTGDSIDNAGDVNGDGIADMIIGAPGASPNGISNAGSSYVVFGSDQGWLSSLELATLDGTNGVRMDAVLADGYAGGVVHGINDVNGDGFDDMAVDSAAFSPGGSYVVFGSGGTLSPTFDLSSVDGTNGFQISGPIDNFTPTSDAGDVNGDGFDDIMVMRSITTCDSSLGFPLCSTQQAVSVVFGTDQGFPANIGRATLDGTNGFDIVGPNVAFGAAASSAGDVNGDGIADLVTSDFGASGLNGTYVGQVYVIFGSTQPFPATLDVAALDGNNGFRIEGAVEYGHLGFPVSDAGDVNGDGFDDLLIGHYGLTFDPGMYVVYGSGAPFPPVIHTGSLTGSQGFLIDLDDLNDGSYLTISDGGDINGDGFQDFVVGSTLGQPNGLLGGGKAFTVFGNNFTASATHAGGAGNDVLIGTANGDVMIGGVGNDFLRGRGGADVLKGGAGNDALVVSDAGFRRLDGGGGKDALVVDGFDLDLTAIPDLRIRNVEVVALGGVTLNQVTLALRDLRTISETSNTITIVGGSGDKVVIDLTGTGFQPTDLGNGFIEYTAQNVNNGLSLMVQDSLDLSGIIF